MVFLPFHYLKGWTFVALYTGILVWPLRMGSMSYGPARNIDLQGPSTQISGTYPQPISRVEARSTLCLCTWDTLGEGSSHRLPRVARRQVQNKESGGPRKLPRLGFWLRFWFVLYLVGASFIELCYIEIHTGICVVHTYIHANVYTSMTRMHIHIDVCTDT